MAPHPLDNLSVEEVNAARQVILDDYSGAVVYFREIYSQEPAKAELQLFLREEHSGRLNSNTKRPARLAKCQFDVIGASKIPEFQECTVDLEQKVITQREVVDVQHHASLTM